MTDTPWVTAVRALTKEAKKKRGEGWKQFALLVNGPMDPEQVANDRNIPSRAYAYKLILCIRKYDLCEIPEAVEEKTLRAQFEDPTPADKDDLITHADAPEEEEAETLPGALHLSGAEKATEFYSGRYLLFVSGDEGIAIYLCILKATPGPDGTPRYAMWRYLDDGSRKVYRGGYFVSDDHLYLLGGRPEAVSLRMIILRIHNVDQKEYKGQTLFVNSRNTIISCRTYLAPHKSRFEELPDRLITKDELQNFDENAHRYFSTADQFLAYDARGID